MTNRFYALEVFDGDHNPVPTQCKPYHRQSIDFYSEGMTHFQYVCLEALAEDAEYVDMRAVRYVRLTLLGEYRMIWLMGARVLWRSMDALPPLAPPPPPKPPVPPMPVAPPDPPPFLHDCHEYQHLAFGNTYPVAFEEPCGLTPAACCALSYDHNHTAAWHLSPSGCCTLLEVPEADHAGLKAGSAPTIDGQTTRPVVEWSGARKALISEFF